MRKTGWTMRHVVDPIQKSSSLTVLEPWPERMPTVPRKFARLAASPTVATNSLRGRDPLVSGPGYGAAKELDGQSDSTPAVTAAASSAQCTSNVDTAHPSAKEVLSGSGKLGNDRKARRRLRWYRSWRHRLFTWLAPEGVIVILSRTWCASVVERDRLRAQVSACSQTMMFLSAQLEMVRAQLAHTREDLSAADMRTIELRKQLEERDAHHGPR